MGNSNKDTERKKGLEEVADEIDQKPATANPLEGKSGDDKKALQEEAAAY